MRAAPAVEVAVSPPAAARHAVALLAALASASMAAWVAGHAGASPAWGWLALVPGAVLGHWLGPGGRAALAWDGERWHCDGRPGRVAETRELVVPGSNYLVPYRVHEGRVEILAIVHAARDWPESF